MRLIKVAFASLVNLIVDREVVKELIQGAYEPESVNSELRGILQDGPKREKVLEGYSEMRKLLGNKKASQETARLIYENISA